MTSTHKLTTIDRVYGEIYEANGIYWAEAILSQDGFDSVVEKSGDFGNRKLAAAWLNDRKIAFAQPFDEALVQAFSALSTASFWSRLRHAFSVGGSFASAN